MEKYKRIGIDSPHFKQGEIYTAEQADLSLVKYPERWQTVKPFEIKVGGEYSLKGGKGVVHNTVKIHAEVEGCFVGSFKDDNGVLRTDYWDGQGLHLKREYKLVEKVDAPLPFTDWLMKTEGVYLTGEYNKYVTEYYNFLNNKQWK